MKVGKKIFAMGLMATVLAWGGVAQAASDYLLRIEGIDIDGGAQKDNYGKWIDAYAFSWGLSNSGTVVGGGAGKASFQDLSVTLPVEISTPPLFVSVATGRHHEKVTLDVVRSGDRGGLYFQMIFEDVLATSLSLSAGGGEPIANASFAYGAVQIRYRPLDATGNFGDWVEGRFSLVLATPTFRGDPQAMLGLFLSGGQVNLDGPVVFDDAVPIPEPGTWALAALGLLVLGARRRQVLRR